MSASDASLLEAKTLTREFDEGQVKALRGVDFSIKEGEFVAIIGPSGCGKSTLLQLLGALDRPTSGTLFYRGISLPDHPNPAAYRAREVGFIFQAFHLLPTFTAAENVQIPMFEIDRSASERRARAFELLKLVGLEHRLDHFPSKLSGGERQRIESIISPPNFPVASDSASPSRGVSLMGHLCSLRMNRPVISIARTLIRFSTSLLVCNKSRVAPWCSSLMTQRLPAGQEGFFT